MITTGAERVARQFAQALDRDDFEAARALLAPECVYQGRTAILIGPEAILQSYRDASHWGRARLSRVDFSSAVRPESDGRQVIRYIDRIWHAGQCHSYQCEQVLSFGRNAEIVHILHRELPGQREALLRFFAEVGVVDDRG